jgi:hypothetical protein
MKIEMSHPELPDWKLVQLGSPNPRINTLGVGNCTYTVG